MWSRTWGQPFLAAAGFLAGVGIAQVAPTPAGKPAAGQRPDPTNQGVTLRTTTTLVQVHVVARDAQGRSVAGLKKDDFEVLDNGKPQEIATFAAETAASAPQAAPLSAFPG